MISELIKYIPKLIILILIIIPILMEIVKMLINIKGFNVALLDYNIRKNLIRNINKACSEDVYYSTSFKIDFSKADIGFVFDNNGYVEKIIIYSCPSYDFSKNLSEDCETSGIFGNRICYVNKHDSVPVGEHSCDSPDQIDVSNIFLRNLSKCKPISEYNLGCPIDLSINQEMFAPVLFNIENYDIETGTLVVSTEPGIGILCKKPIIKTLGTFLHKKAEMSSIDFYKKKILDLDYDKVYVTVYRENRNTGPPKVVFVIE